MAGHRFTQVDVFTSQPLQGNPVAVVHDSAGLEVDVMQRFAHWTNLSETTFLGPPTRQDADYSVRIFTPERELPFAGHPTLGSCHSWLAAGGVPKGDVVVQECGVGLVHIRRDESGGLSFAAPERERSGPLSQAQLERVMEGLGVDRAEVVDHQWCDNGPPWHGVLLRSAERVLSIRPDGGVLDGLFVGVVGAHSSGRDADFEVRDFFPGPNGLMEDPVTGSLNAAIGQWLISSGQAPDRYVVAQGTALGRAGRVVVERAGNKVWVGGGCHSVVKGTVLL